MILNFGEWWYSSVTDPEASERGRGKNMKYELQHLAAIFFMTNFYWPGGTIATCPLLDPATAAVVCNHLRNLFIVRLAWFHNLPCADLGGTWRSHQPPWPPILRPKFCPSLRLRCAMSAKSRLGPLLTQILDPHLNSPPPRSHAPPLPSLQQWSELLC